MGFVCLNLDFEDASVLRRTLARALHRSPVEPATEDDRALHAMIGELDRMLDSETRRRVVVSPIGMEQSPSGPRLQLMRGGRIE